MLEIVKTTDQRPDNKIDYIAMLYCYIDSDKNLPQNKFSVMLFQTQITFMLGRVFHLSHHSLSQYVKKKHSEQWVGLSVSYILSFVFSESKS